ncbi:MAG: hypothetical protein QG602_94 [Verrucomicrobiota bacterium]|nr:hypothetical protein [Verrucomicrobiota bacterium]
MRRSKEIILLLALLVGAMGFVLWYVIDRRAKNRAAPAPVTRNLSPEPPPAGTQTVLPPKEEVVLGATTERKTVDFSSGQAVVKDSAEDRAAIDEAMKDIAEATKGVTFEPAKKPKDATPPKQP